MAVPCFAGSSNNNAQVTLTSATTSTSSAVALVANANRRSLYIQNTDASITVYLKFGAAHSGTEGIKLIAGAVYEPAIPPIQSVYLKAASGTPVVTIYEGN